jgi:hypothetical protein
MPFLIPMAVGAEIELLVLACCAFERDGKIEAKNFFHGAIFDDLPAQSIDVQITGKLKLLVDLVPYASAGWKILPAGSAWL